MQYHTLMLVDSGGQLEQARSLVRFTPHEGARLAETAMSRARKICDNELLQEALTVLGHCRFQQGEHIISLQHFKEAIELNKKRSTNADRYEAELVLMLGANHANLGETEQAFEFYAEGLRLEREQPSEKGLAFALHHVGSGCRERKDFAKAEMFISEALGLYTKLADTAGEAMCRVTLGLAAQEQGDFAGALPLLTTALQVAIKAKDVRQEILARLNLAWTLLNLGEVGKAEENFLETLELSERIEGRHYQGWVFGGLGHVYRVKGDIPKAVRYFEQALAIAETLKLVKGQVMVHEALYQTLENAGEFKRALQHYKAFHQAERKVLSERAERDMQMVAAKLEADLAKREVEELSAWNAKLQHQAAWLERLSLEDSLTGLYNRRHLDTALQKAFAASLRSGKPLSLIVADIDHFKRINDTFTHTLGDAVLCQMAALLRENCRSTDTIARYGGEEFVVLLPETSLELATDIAERVRVAVSEFDWSRLCPGLTVTLSLGVAEQQGMTKLSPEQLLAKADGNLYKAKGLGRNRVVSG